MFKLSVGNVLMMSATADKLLGECPELHQVSAAPSLDLAWATLLSLQIMVAKERMLIYGLHCQVRL